jgi:hypothetical protein
MERIDARLQDLKRTFVTIDRATAKVRPGLLKRGKTRAQIREAQANLRGAAIDEFLDHLNAWIRR